MAISAAGLGSGLDIESIISGIMAVERRPLQLIEQRQSDIQTKISAYGSLKSSISKFQDALNDLKSINSFQVFSTKSTDDSVFSASANSTAVEGVYEIGFLNSNPAHQKALSHKIDSTGFADSSTATGVVGTMEIDVGGNSFTIDVDATNDTLSGIRDAINQSADNDNLVTATVINVDDGLGGTESRLLITSKETGTDNTISLTDISGNISTGLSLTSSQAAQNAVFTLDGYTVTSQSNTVKNAIQGVTINLEEKSDTNQTLTISYDEESVKESVQKFVDSYNDLANQLKSLRQTQLSGDNTLVSIESRIRSILNTAPSGLTGNYNYLSEIGIKTNKSGELSLDETELTNALDLDYSGVAELFANNDQGYVFRLEALTDDLLANEGIVKIRTDTLDDQKDSLEDRKFSVEYRLDLVEQRFRRQFTQLDTLLSSLSATGNYLNQQLANLPGAK